MINNQKSQIIRLIPHLFTSTNVICGGLSIFFILTSQPYTVLILLIISLLADFLDGFVARVLGVPSELGKELDSLADVISFGLVPAIILTTLFVESISGSPFSLDNIEFWQLCPMVLVAFAAFRLAKFNIDTRQTDAFIGLNTPAATMFVLGIWLDKLVGNNGLSFIHEPWIIFILSIGLGVLMVSEVRFFSLKIKDLSWNKNAYRYILVGLSVLWIFMFKFVALSLIIITYFVLSLLKEYILKSK